MGLFSWEFSPRVRRHSRHVPSNGGKTAPEIAQISSRSQERDKDLISDTSINKRASKKQDEVFFQQLKGLFPARWEEQNIVFWREKGGHLRVF